MFGKKNTTLDSSESLATSSAGKASNSAAQSTLNSENNNTIDLQKKAADANPQTTGKTDKVYITSATADAALKNEDYHRARNLLIEVLVDRFDFRSIESLPEASKRERINGIINNYINTELQIPLTANQQRLLSIQVLDDLLGFGPLETLLSDPEISDIMINGSKQIYIERAGKIYLSDVQFASERHLLNVVQKIVSLVGRRVDESSPMVDARMPDGSRFNAIVPPLALDGCLVSIRKFKRNKMPLSDYAKIKSMSNAMADFLAMCAAMRLNIIVSGGTGSGKTTLLNALSGHIDLGERVVTIEDAAELQLHQPHVLRLETRPPNIEGAGEINQRQLVKNALRMRPDRIILGEMRGDEVIDVLSAMNTGHDGSMATIHSNNPRDCLARIENLVGMSGVTISPASLRYQISSAVNLIVQLERMRDGGRRITYIDEILGVEGDRILSQTLFGFKAGAPYEDGRLSGVFFSNHITPNFIDRAEYYGLKDKMMACINSEDLRI
jgi:pilus assembly protein CpaF